MKLPRLQRKGKAFYHVSGKSPRVWTPLGSNFAAAMREYERIEAGRGKRTVAALISAFVTDKHAWTAGTRAQYRSYARHLTRVFGDMAPDEIERYDVLTYLDKCPRTTAEQEISVLRQVMERAVRAKLCPANPCIHVKPLHSLKKKRTRRLTDVEYDAIRAHAGPLLAAAMDLAWLTALRVGDLCRLKWGDLEAGIKTGKTGAWLRFRMDAELRAALDAAKALQGRVACLYVLSERNHPVDRWRIGELWREAVAKAGVQDAQFRDLRAKSASDDPETAQERLGHTSAQMTKTYLRGIEVKDVATTKRRKT